MQSGWRRGCSPSVPLQSCHHPGCFHPQCPAWSHRTGQQSHNARPEHWDMRSSFFWQNSKLFSLTLQSLSASHFRAQSAHSLTELWVEGLWGFPYFFFNLGHPSNTATNGNITVGTPKDHRAYILWLWLLIVPFDCWHLSAEWEGTLPSQDEGSWGRLSPLDPLDQHNGSSQDLWFSQSQNILQPILYPSCQPWCLQYENSQCSEIAQWKDFEYLNRKLLARSSDSKICNTRQHPETNFIWLSCYIEEHSWRNLCSHLFPINTAGL